MKKSFDDRYRLAFEFANAGMFFVSLDGQIEEANTRACEFFGIEPGGLNGLTVNDIALADDREVSFNAIQRLVSRESDRETFEKRYRHRDGHIVHGLISVALVRDSAGEPAYFISHMQDISHLKQIEADLRENEERLNLALDASGLGCWDWDIANSQVYFDSKAFSVLGYTHHELNPAIKRWEDLAHPEERASVHTAVEAHKQGDTPTYVMERRYRHKDGHWVWVLERGKVIARGEEGIPLRMTGTLENITHRRLLETEATTLLSKFEVLLKHAARPHQALSEENALPTTNLLSSITSRQLEVLKLVATGFTSAEIGEALQISKETADTHRRDLMKRLGLRSVVALTKFAIQEGLIPNNGR